MPATKPAKPYADFPLTAHRNGQWCKKVRGKIHYFGLLGDWRAALDNYLEQRDWLHAGKAPPLTAETVADVLNSFLNRNLRRMQDGEIAERTFSEYKATCDKVATVFGKNRPVESLTDEDFGQLRSAFGESKKGGRVSPVTHKRLLTFARMVFYHANERMGLSLRYREPLEPPPARLLRQARNEAGEKLYSPGEVRTLIEAADAELRAMIYLGINCGLGNDDCKTLPISAVDLRGGFHNYPRPKTGMPRRCPLWAETCEALAAVIQERSSGTVFRSTWNRHVLGRAFKELCDDTDLYRQGITTFYTLRRTFETIATTASVNQAVIDKIMGHTPRAGDMAAVYRQRIFDDSLRLCTDHVRGWLNGSIELN